MTNTINRPNKKMLRGHLLIVIDLLENIALPKLPEGLSPEEKEDLVNAIIGSITENMLKIKKGSDEKKYSSLKRFLDEQIKKGTSPEKYGVPED